LFERGWVGFSSDGTVNAYNNLFAGQSLCSFDKGGANVWTFRENAFLNTTISDEGGLTNDHNAYINTAGGLVPTNGATDKVLSSLTFQSGALGRFYQPTNSTLIDAGSRFATNAGLYFFTTLTNQTLEGTSTNDIGLHYVGLNTSLTAPLDGDADGLFSYFEDANGNGIFDTGETDWQAYNSLFGIGTGPGLVVLYRCELIRGVGSGVVGGATG
jgi:hypothetical protein